MPWRPNTVAVGLGLWIARWLQMDISQSAEIAILSILQSRLARARSGVRRQAHVCGILLRMCACVCARDCKRCASVDCLWKACGQVRFLFVPVKFVCLLPQRLQAVLYLIIE